MFMYFKPGVFMLTVEGFALAVKLFKSNAMSREEKE